ncbi:MAG: PIG-L deacetylase family protein [Betaproteobacteria bacterium]
MHLLALVSVLVAPAAGAAPRVRALALSVTPATRLLVVSPHPDDETLAAGGLIERVREAGGQVRVVVVTSGDAFAEGVETEDGISRPRPSDYRNYGTLRERETTAALELLGVASRDITFLGFPDDGLCQLASKYLSAKASPFSSPYTQRRSPPTTEQIVRGVAYRGIDVRRELERLFVEFAPTVLVIPHPEDEHPDHCSTHIFAREAIDAVWPRRRTRPRIVQYLIHYGQWPMSAEAGAGSELRPPTAFPAREGRWASLKLTAAESVAKKRALLAYSSQMLVIGRFVLAFGRSNELFLEGEPASLPECWCSGENVATEVPPEKRVRRPPRPRR